MSKIVVVNNCKDCFYCIDDSFYNLGYHCYKTGLDVNRDGDGISEHCPLADLPGKIHITANHPELVPGLESDGWNKCIDHILNITNDVEEIERIGSK